MHVRQPELANERQDAYCYQSVSYIIMIPANSWTNCDESSFFVEVRVVTKKLTKMQALRSDLLRPHPPPEFARWLLLMFIWVWVTNPLLPGWGTGRDANQNLKMLAVALFGFRVLSLVLVLVWLVFEVPSPNFSRWKMHVSIFDRKNESSWWPYLPFP